MIRGHEGVTGETAPGGEIGTRARIDRHQTQQRAGLELLDPETQLQHELTAAEVAGVPGRVGDHPISFASASSRGSTASRGSDGSPKIARSTPAVAS